MRRIRTSRSSYRRRKWHPWLLLALTLAVAALIVVLLVWSQPAQPSPGRVVEISTSASGAHRLDGKPVSLAELEAELVKLKSGKGTLLVAIAGVSLNGPPALPSPEVAALLARLRVNWMSIGLPMPSPPPPTEGGDHGR